MSFSKVTNINEDYTYSASTAVQAQADLQNLKNYLIKDGIEKPGVLRLVKNWDGSIQLKRRQFYQFWNIGK